MYLSYFHQSIFNSLFKHVIYFIILPLSESSVNQSIPLSRRSPQHISNYNVIMTLQCYNKSSFKHPLSNKPFAPLLPLLLFFTMRCINVTLYFTTVTVHAGWSGMVYRGAKKVSFTVYHSGKLQLALLAPKWFQLRPKKLLNSRIDYGSPVIWISLKASFSCQANYEHNSQAW